MSLKTIFKDSRIVALCGIKNSGKTNNLLRLITDYRLSGGKVPIYAYGFPKETTSLFKTLEIQEISSMSQMINKKGCIFILDEMQKLKINDRRYKDTRDEFVDFIYHSNNYVILSSPNIREFNSVIGGVIEKWLLKSIRIDQCINGSQLKKVVEAYKGRHKVLGSIDLPKSNILVINDDCETVIRCEYLEEADTKKKQEKLF